MSTLLDTVWPAEVIIPGIIDTHFHPRDDDEDKDGRAEMNIANASQCYEAIVGIGNTKRPINNAALGFDYKKKWSRLIPPGKPLKILVAGLLSSRLTPEDVVGAYEEGALDAMKLFIHGISNDAGNSVRLDNIVGTDDLERVIPIIRAMSDINKMRRRKRRMPLMIHAEFTMLHEEGKELFILDRENAAVRFLLDYIYSRVPEASIAIEHISDRRTFEVIEEFHNKGYDVWGGIAPHYAADCLNDLFRDNAGTAMQGHKFCIPVPKYPEDKAAVGVNMVSSKPYLYFGSDNACHTDDPQQPSGVKISRGGRIVGGQAQLPEATVSFVIEKFVEAGQLEHLGDFLSGRGMKRFGLVPQTRVRFRREDWVVPPIIHRMRSDWQHIQCVLAMGGETRRYKFDGFLEAA